MLVINVATAGFDAGGGPGKLLERIFEFLGNDVEKFLIGAAIEDFNNSKLILFNPLKSSTPDDEANPLSGLIKGLPQTDDVKYLLAAVYPKYGQQDFYYIVFQYKGNIEVNGKLVFDFKNSVNVYRFDIKNSKLIPINFQNFMDNLCEEKCPDINFIVPKNED
jgi:hypothetical protein